MKFVGYILNGFRFIEDDDLFMDVGGVSSGYKFGGILLFLLNIRSIVV